MHQDNYEDASFEADSNKSSQMHNLKLSIDIMSARNLTVAGNIFVSYQLELTDS